MNATPPSPSVYAEDFTPGQILELGDHTVSKAELVDFATRWDAQWFHIDEEAADQGHFRGLIASGVHTIAIAQRLLTQTMLNQWAVIAGLGFDRVRFPVPVRPGNVLTGTAQIAEITLDGTRGRVKIEMRLTDQDDHTVLYAELTIVMWQREQATTPSGGFN